MLDLHRTKLSEDEYKPFDQGWDANIDEKHQGYNPWAITNWKYYDWQEGWLAAEKQRQAEQEEDILSDRRTTQRTLKKHGHH